MNEKSQNLLNAIARYLAVHHYPPSMRELMPLLPTTSTGVVRYHLDILERAKLIERTPYVSRGIVVTPAGEKFLARA